MHYHYATTVCGISLFKETLSEERREYACTIGMREIIRKLKKATSLGEMICTNEAWIQILSSISKISELDDGIEKKRRKTGLASREKSSRATGCKEAIEMDKEIP